MGAVVTSPNGIRTKLLWAGIVALGALSLGIVALNRGETINAAWLVIAALCVYFIAYRFKRISSISTAVRVGMEASMTCTN